MEFMFEDDPSSTETSYFQAAQGNWYGSDCDIEEPVRDTANIVSQLQCQEAEARKSDLQLACKLDELANSLRSGLPPSFCDNSAPYSPGQSLSEFLCILEKRLHEKSQAQEVNHEDLFGNDCNICPSKSAKKHSPSQGQGHSHRQGSSHGNSHIQRGKRPKTPPSKINHPNVTIRSKSPRRHQESPPLPDWKSMNADSSELICYPSDMLSMHGSTAGDIWKQRSQEKSNSCRCNTPPKVRTPVRQVKAIPVRCIPSPRYDEESLIYASEEDMGYYGYDVDEILRNKSAKKRKVAFEGDETPSWLRQDLDDSPHFTSKRSSHKSSPSRKVMIEDTKITDNNDCEVWEPSGQSSRRDNTDDMQSNKVFSDKSCQERMSRCRSSSNMCCCCDDLPQRVNEWMEKQFGAHTDKGINAGFSCQSLTKDRKPMLKRKPCIRTKKIREPCYNAFLSGIGPCFISTPRKPSGTPLQCFECSSPQLMGLMRESTRRSCSHHRSSPKHNHTRMPAKKHYGIPRNIPVKLHLVTPPAAFFGLDECDDD